MTSTADCERCDGLGMTLDLTDPDTGADYYRPCPDCRPEAHARFLEGHLESGHDCPACRARRLGKPEPKPEPKVEPAWSPPPRDITEPTHRDSDARF